MDPQRYQRAKELFRAARELPADQRARYLNSQHGLDAELLAEVQSLLDVAESAADFLEEPVDGIVGILASGSIDFEDRSEGELHEPTIGAGDRIGQYVVLSVLASGGMGVVYKAMQESPHRPVALKVMRSRIVSRDTLRRFKDEAEILAQLRHPNIAQIYEASTHFDKSVRKGGEVIPFFAM